MAAIHAALSRRIPLEEIEERRVWRDRRILALLRMKREVPGGAD
jgi:hypothetical protein